MVYIFKLLTEIEYKYEIYNKLILALIRGLKALKYLLLNLKRVDFVSFYFIILFYFYFYLGLDKRCHMTVRMTNKILQSLWSSLQKI